MTAPMRREVHQSAARFPGDPFLQDARHSRTAQVAAAEAPPQAGQESSGSPDAICHGLALSRVGAGRPLDRSAPSGGHRQRGSQRGAPTPASGGAAPCARVTLRIRILPLQRRQAAADQDGSHRPGADESPTQGARQGQSQQVPQRRHGWKSLHSLLREGTFGPAAGWPSEPWAAATEKFAWTARKPLPCPTN
jgi:hypothetical protein